MQAGIFTNSPSVATSQVGIVAANLGKKLLARTRVMMSRMVVMRWSDDEL